MALPTSGNPIKFSQVNDELSNGTTDSLSLRTASAAFSLSTPDSISEMFGLSATNTTWGTLNTFSIYVEATNNSDQGTSTLQTITLADGSGDTSISCQQPSNGNIELKVAASTSGDPCNGIPSADGTSNGGTGFVNNLSTLNFQSGTLRLRFRLIEIKTTETLNEETRTITFTNNGVSTTANASVRLTLI